MTPTLHAKAPEPFMTLCGLPTIQPAETLAIAGSYEDVTCRACLAGGLVEALGNLDTPAIIAVGLGELWTREN